MGSCAAVNEGAAHRSDDQTAEITPRKCSEQEKSSRRSTQDPLGFANIYAANIGRGRFS
jgi:hypothetical protein